MFSKGSRYRNLPESSTLTTQVDRPRGKELRPIPRLTGQFLHLVREGDRLDLLGVKYYGDPTKWWQIADANPEYQFPADALDRDPFIEERIALTDKKFFERFEDLRIEIANKLGGLAEVRVGEMISFDDKTLPRQPDFLESEIVVIQTPSPGGRQQVIDEINSRFHLLRTVAWAEGAKTAEAFTFDDSQVKSSWRAMIAELADKPGVVEVQSTIAEASLGIAYHGGMLQREDMLKVINAHGFSVEGSQSAVLLRTGAKIVIPPNQIV